MVHKPLKILQASAGSGKTFSLAAHYLILLFSGENKYREILAVTFTNKATAEMKSRILSVLQDLAEGNRGADAYRPIILAALPFLHADTLQQKARQVYRQILHDYNRFSVNTIDGFVQKVIRSFSYELGLDAGYKLEMNLEKVKLDLADRLNKRLDQKPALLEWIISLVMKLLEDNKSWNYHATLVDLSGELFKERYLPFEEALKEKDPALIFGELRQQTAGVIADFEKTLVKTALDAQKIFDDSGILPEELKGKSRSPLNNLARIADGNFDKIDTLAKLLNEPDEWQKGGLSAGVSALYAALNPLLERIYTYYQDNLVFYTTAQAINANMYYLRLMQEMGTLLADYRDENQALLISDAQSLLKGITGGQDGNPSFVWEKTGNRFRHFLFDEFQDTSGMQWTNFLPLVQNALGEPGQVYTDHLIVGDVKQSIYRWRGGDWNILLKKAQQDLGEWSVGSDSLEENYRSSANIIDFNNFLFRHIPGVLQRHINTQIAENGGAIAGWWENSGYTSIITDAYAQSQQQKAPSTPAGGSIDVEFLSVDNNRFRGSQVREEALERLSENLKSWVRTAANPGRKYDAGQICILVRSNSEARAVIEKLMLDQQQNDEYDRFQILSGEALLISGNEAVQLIINTLHAMVGKRDELSLYLGNCAKMYASLHDKTLPADAWLQFRGQQPETLSPLLPAELCRNWLAWQQFPLGEIFEKLLVAYRLHELRIHIPYLMAFRDLLAGFSRQGERGISLFLQWWEEEGAAKALPSAEQRTAVQVMTIHKSKGLAFDVVMLPFCSWDLDGKSNSIFWVGTGETPYASLGSAPVRYSKELGKSAFGKAYFEELLYNYMDALNMLYVAVTRTRFHLYITAPDVARDGADLGISGDLIREALSLYGEELQAAPDKGIHINEPVSPLKIRQAGDAGWSFPAYPVSERLDRALAGETVFEQLDLLSGNTARRRGVILHDVLARAATAEEVAPVLRDMQQKGLFRQNEFDELKTLAENVLRQSDLAALLAKPYTTVNEQTIITKTGSSYRPDKVLLGASETLIIDFKFTDEPKPAHDRQVANYKILLGEIGYTNIRTYLYYGLLNELKEVGV